MSREWDTSGETYPYQLWEQTVKKAIEGKNGQKVLRRLEAALLALSSKRLIDGSLCRTGEVCALGALALSQKPRLRAWLDLQREMEDMYAYWSDDVGLYEMGDYARRNLGCTYVLGATIADQNDNYGWSNETPEDRYERMLRWVRFHLKDPVVAA